jgi:hypothetical protein
MLVSFGSCAHTLARSLEVLCPRTHNLTWYCLQTGQTRAGQGVQPLGTLLNVIGVDGLKRPLVLALGHFDKENADNYKTLLEFVTTWLGDSELFKYAMYRQPALLESDREYDNAKGFLIVMGDHSPALQAARSQVLPGALAAYCTLHREVSSGTICVSPSLRHAWLLAPPAAPPPLLFLRCC